MNTQALFAKIEGATIRITEDGKISVIDVIKEVTGYGNNYAGFILRRIKTDSEDIRTNLCENNFGNKGRPTPVADKKTVISIMQMLPGIAGDKFRAATAELVLGYLNADIEIAHSIIDRNTNPQELQRLAVRAQGKVARHGYTSTLAYHGVHGEGFSKCTDAINVPILGAKSSVVKKEMGLKKDDNLRDNLPSASLSALMFAELGAEKMIKDKDAWGNAECELLSNKAGNIVASALRQMGL